MATEYYQPQYASEQALRDIGYNGPFSAGQGDAWLVSQSEDVKKNFATRLGALGGSYDVTTGKYGTTNPAVPQTLTGYMSNTVQNPTLPVGSELVPQTMQVQNGELQNFTPIAAPQVTAAQPIAAPQLATTTAAPAVMVDPNTGQQFITGPQTYAATTVSANTPQMQAAQGTVSELATVQGQLKKLYADTANGEVPEWAQGAMRKAESVMAARGLGASSIAAGAITEAIQQSAIQIAAPDAATYFQMDLTNLSNEQQARLENVRMRQQSLLSDQAAENAAKQFNASSTQQIQMFQAELVSRITTANADRKTALEQFNAAQANQMELAGAQIEVGVAQFNEQQRSAIEQYNANMKFQTDTFNSNMAQVIDQSNVQWRRQINTANTAAINASNQVNVQNKFNLSNYALNALWQQIRDESSWAYQSSENAAERAFRLAAAANQYEYSRGLAGYTSDLNFENGMWEAVGRAGISIIGDL